MEPSIKRRLTALEREQEDDLVIEDMSAVYTEILGSDHPFVQRYTTMMNDGSLGRAIREQLKSERRRRKW